MNRSGYKTPSPLLMERDLASIDRLFIAFILIHESYPNGDRHAAKKNA